MLVTFNPAITNNKSQSPTFKAVNQKWLTKIKGDVDLADNDFYFELLAGDISRTDCLDTLKAAKEHYAPKFQEFFKRTIEHIEKVKLRCEAL